MVPPEPRLPEVRDVIDEEKYFVLHAPRQTGKTTVLASLARTLTAEGRHAALWFSCEAASVAEDDFGAAERIVLEAIRSQADWHLLGELLPPDPWPDAPDGFRLHAALKAWAERCARPLVLFFDEIDALQGRTLLAVLRQLRNGYTARPVPFPASVGLCGLRDVRDYKVASGGDPTRLASSSPFNIKVKSMRLGDFTEKQLWALYGQHTAETGQEFTEAALERAFAYSQGQPWLTNAIAREVTKEMRITPPQQITADHIDEAKERLILARATHLDSLVARLAEPRVKRVMQPVIAGDMPSVDDTYHDDVAYLRDLGLLTPKPPVAVANPIYREVVVRVLGTRTEDIILADPRSFVLSDGRLDFRRLLEEFAAFWRQNAEVLVDGALYREAAPQLIIMAFMHRIVNGGGYIEREYGVGHGRIDLMVRWPYFDSREKRVWQREAVELKVWKIGKPDPTSDGLRQLDEYLDRLGLDYGALVVFDQRPEAAPIDERTIFATDYTPKGREVTLLRA